MICSLRGQRGGALLDLLTLTIATRPLEAIAQLDDLEISPGQVFQVVRSEPYLVPTVLGGDITRGRERDVATVRQ